MFGNARHFETFDKLVDNLFNQPPMFTSTRYFFDENESVKYVSSTDGIEIALPGFSKEDLQIVAEDHELKISANVEKENETDFKKSFTMKFALPNISTDSITASMTNGILSIKYNAKEKSSKNIKIV